jgi:hypothetical protein
MKKYFTIAYDFIKEFAFLDLVNRFLLPSSIVIAAAAYLIWKQYLSSPDLFVYTRLGTYPIKYMALILVINVFLAASSYNKEKELSYLLLIANIIVSLLIVSLEIFYLINI